MAATSQGLDSGTMCTIRWESYNTGSEPKTPVTLKCGHIFGSVCVGDWYEKLNSDNHMSGIG